MTYMPNINIFLQFFFLFLMNFMLLYNLFYMRGAYQAQRQLGIALPTKLGQVLIVNIGLTLISLMIIIFFLLRGS